MLNIGPHVSKLDSPNAQRANARENGWGTIQTFAGQNQKLSVDPGKVPSDEDGQRDVIWVVHSSYPAHFIPKEEHQQANSAYLLNLAKWCKNAGAQFMVVHLGATKDRDPKDVVYQAQRYWAKNEVLHDYLRVNKIKLLIENVAAAYPTNQDLQHTINLTKDTPDILGWCLDTAHSNAAGVKYDILQRIIENPETAPDILHCNYPGSKFGSGLDRHGCFYKDETPVYEEIKGLWKSVVRAAFKAKIPFVVEGSSNPASHAEEVQALRILCTDPEGNHENSSCVHDETQLISPE